MTVDTIIFGNPVSAWWEALLAAFVTGVLLYIARVLVRRRLSVAARRTATRADDIAVEVISGTRFLAVLAVALFVATHFVELRPKPQRFIEHGVMVVLLLQGAIWAQRALVAWLRLVLEQRQGDAAAATTLSVTAFIAKLALWSLTVLMILDALGFNVTALVTGLGIGGVAVALAAQSILGDLFAGLVIAIDKPFVIGDFVILEDIMGTVDQIGIKTTRLRSLGGEEITIPNSDLLKGRIRNYKRMNERRAAFRFGVIYQTDAAKLEHIPAMIREIVEHQPATRMDRVHFARFGDSSLDFDVVYFVLDPDYNRYMDVQHAINLEIFRRFAEEGIEFAYPTRTIQISPPATRTPE